MILTVSTEVLFMWFGFALYEPFFQVISVLNPSYWYYVVTLFLKIQRIFIAWSRDRGSETQFQVIWNLK